MKSNSGKGLILFSLMLMLRVMLYKRLRTRK